MTVIAFDGVSFAADSRMTGSYIDQKACRKLHRIKTFGRDLIVGFAGEVSFGQSFVGRIKTTKKLEDLQADPFSDNIAFESLVYDCRTKQLYFFTANLLPTRVGKPASIGSGAGFAMGAMMHGADAKTACKIACKLDENSALPIREIVIG